MNRERPFLTVGEVAELLDVSRVRAYQMAAEGRFPVVRMSPRRLRIPRAAFEQWLADQAAVAMSNVRNERDG